MYLALLLVSKNMASNILQYLTIPHSPTNIGFLLSSQQDREHDKQGQEYAGKQPGCYQCKLVHWKGNTAHGRATTRRAYRAAALVNESIAIVVHPVA
jgi:hypothetical protein